MDVDRAQRLKREGIHLMHGCWCGHDEDDSGDYLHELVNARHSPGCALDCRHTHSHIHCFGLREDDAPAGALLRQGRGYRGVRSGAIVATLPARRAGEPSSAFSSNLHAGIAGL